jgi:hypothetical protein
VRPECGGACEGTTPRFSSESSISIERSHSVCIGTVDKLGVMALSPKYLKRVRVIAPRAGHPGMLDLTSPRPKHIGLAKTCNCRSAASPVANPT